MGNVCCKKKKYSVRKNISGRNKRSIKNKKTEEGLINEENKIANSDRNKRSKNKKIEESKINEKNKIANSGRNKKSIKNKKTEESKIIVPDFKIHTTENSTEASTRRNLTREKKNNYFNVIENNKDIKIIKKKKKIKKEEDHRNNKINENKVITDLKKEKKNNDLNKNYDEDKDYYFVCPRCKCRSPHIENLNFDINIKDFNVSYYCACLYNDKKVQKEFLNLLISSKSPSNKCPIHSENTLQFYCKECKQSFCDLCEEDNNKEHKIKEHKKDLVNYNNIMSEDNAKTILEKSSLTKYEDIYKKIVEEYLIQLNAPKYHCKSSLKDHSDKVTALIQLQSGLIATGSYDTTIRIWNLEKLSCDKIIQCLGKIFVLLEFEENMLLSSSENTIFLWDLKSDKNECIHKFDGHELWVNCLVKCDDKTFASASNDCSIIIWDYYKKSIIKKFEAHDDCILALIKLKDGNLCSGSVDKLIKIWNLKEEKSIKNLSGHKNWVKCLCQMDNETLLSGSDDKTIKVWKNYVCINTIKQHTHSVRVLLKINDDYFISGSFDKSIKIWDIKKYKCHQTINETSSALCIAKLNNNDLISSHSDNRVILWEKL